MTAPRRRWTFGLRTLFVVVTVLGCWLGWQVDLVQERRSLLPWIEDNATGWSHPHLVVMPRVSWIRSLLGDQYFIDAITFPADVDEAKLREGRRAFPEGTFGVYSQPEDSPVAQADRP
jgi:hypothetical protein